MIRLLIADDHAIVREGLKQLIALTLDIEIAGEATNGSEVLQQVQGGIFDLLLLDMNMPGVNGSELIGSSRYASLAHSGLQYAQRSSWQAAFKAGARYFTKNSDPKMLMEAIRDVAAANISTGDSRTDGI